MGYWFACPECYEILDLDDNGNSKPTAKTKLMGGIFCGNCGCNLISPLQEAVRNLIAQREQNEDDNSDQD